MDKKIKQAYNKAILLFIFSAVLFFMGTAEDAKAISFWLNAIANLAFFGSIIMFAVTYGTHSKIKLKEKK